MTDLPETDLNLSPHFKSARRFLHWLCPADAVEHYQANVRADEVEQKRSPHVFVLKDDALFSGKARNDPALSNRLFGDFDSCATRLAEANIRARTGVFVQLDTARVLVAHYQGAPKHGQGGTVHSWEGLGAMPPSARLTTRHDRETWIWLLSDGPLPIKDRNDIGAVLWEKHGGKIETGTTALVRVPGFYARDGQPFQVTGYGAEYGGMETKRYRADDLRQVFLRPVEAPVEAPSPPAVGKQSAEAEAALRQARFKDLTSKGFSVEEAAQQTIVEREAALAFERIAGRCS